MCLVDDLKYRSIEIAFLVFGEAKTASSSICQLALKLVVFYIPVYSY